jgi:hypothetical protein
MKDIPTLVALSDKAYASRNFERALALLNEIIEITPESADGLGSRDLRAMAYECGNVPSGIDHKKALSDYRYLADRSHLVGSVGLVGCARILCQQNPKTNLDEARQLCLRAVEIDGDVRAKMLLGYMCADVTSDFKGARKWFISAFRGGSPWGLRYAAATFWRERKVAQAIVMSTTAKIAWHVLSSKRSSKSPYH